MERARGTLIPPARCLGNVRPQGTHIMAGRGSCRGHGSRRGPAGAAHSSDYSMWRESQYASHGLRDFAERGEAWVLMRELQAAGEQLQSVHEVFSAPAVPSGTGQTSAELEVHARHSLVSGGQPEGGQEREPWWRLTEHTVPRCPLWSASSPAPTGLWASTVWICVTGTDGGSGLLWTFTPTMPGQTVASPSPPRTSQPSRRTQ